MNWEDSKKIEELAAYMALLAVPGVGPRTLSRLIRGFGSAHQALGRGVAELERKAGISRSLASSLATSTTSQNIDLARESAERIKEMGWGVLLDTDADYPGALLEIASRPPLLFYLGEFTEDDERAIAVVGSRMCSDEGRDFAYRTGGGLARKEITVVSGMARGIDTAAHKGALALGGRTIAVLGCALDYKFSPMDREKIEKISGSGVVISEFLPGTPTLPEHFPRRNRIISGLSQGVVVIEAGVKSGALLTAGNALDQNRELFAVPGFPGRHFSRGTNNLIKQGANLFTDVADIFERLPRLNRQVQVNRIARMETLTNTEERIIQQFTDGPLQLDNLSDSLGLPVTELMPTLLALELKGMVRELAGKRFTLSE